MSATFPASPAHTQHATDFFELYASCPQGFEAALARELKFLHMHRVRPLKGRVTFSGTVEDAMRTCQNTRLASRVYVVLGRFDAVTADELYAGSYALTWEDILTPGSSLAISVQGVTRELRNTQFIAQKVKDALCDRLIDTTGQRPDIELANPDARVHVAVKVGRVSISLDLAGQPLFKRLSKHCLSAAGELSLLRSDYAAFVLAQLGWLDSALDKRDHASCLGTLVDLSPSAGIALEAACTATQTNMHASRTKWGYDAWQAASNLATSSGAGTLAKLSADMPNAEAKQSPQPQQDPLRIFASVDDTHRQTVQRICAAAGVQKDIHIVNAQFDAILKHINAPERKADLEQRNHQAPYSQQVLYLAADMRDVPFAQAHQSLQLIQQLFETSTREVHLALLSRDTMPERIFSHAHQHIELMLQNEPISLYCYTKTAQRVSAHHHELTSKTLGNLPDGSPVNRVPATAHNVKANQTPIAQKAHHADNEFEPALLIPESIQFANRLKKNLRHLRKWARREHVNCYRVYDADLPDYAAAIDLYEGSATTPGRWLVLAEYAPPKSVDPAKAQARLLDMLTLAPQILEVDASCVYARARTRSRGGSQYGRQKGYSAQQSIHPIIEEGGLSFELNFDDYLDTGIFLDHRLTRNLVRSLARERKSRYFLNLFAYTGTASCYAADGGVQETVTVDLSNTYLDWAERNMAANGFTGSEHYYVRDDVLGWLQGQIRRNNQWDLIFCDPPTFSNSSKMGQRSWDVQRDHVELLSAIQQILMPSGVAVFSCNLRNFKPAWDELAALGLKLTDISAQTIPPDFARNQKIHHCYLVEHV
ncbi:bifunctional 23S rRNA (guanine(2069)-N(7))-methyltransferase RlmK/23S rRNA (guanine(2445)-N(2))-methyltransferase RlmL [Collinsella sp. zg1085]|uniref:bifunctional 23S rRNA (guanine(2069)-N(7))-methyltransferase RlmK/23S rRNA (guanine(2445)-N(2))-methyltransferase RlmL n=1 Tax=Collinsella sp. zg1085 TaxID=2844380 RepID=UPI001C0E3E78|nr:bifunctional 23S rRNA (guanine(2069)-N(7))-methyltransferase RlmK/23S rRNA (guanine(2445)-N(2))-methyltransferase RlmL [Collinsella sp. zg1085]QWT17658.1 bifunctional 23S rRNA (guanine(2069)-N(7))-methyltransferase RlmK/23S rRNA (guanine(2445)-N(2))-methyltransferase RlmL [Collinsella sp. zg1085]